MIFFQNNQANSVIYPYLLNLILQILKNNYENLIYFRLVNIIAIILLIFFNKIQNIREQKS